MSAREQVVEAARSFSAAGLTIATWGNISLRSGESVFITPSGMDYAALLPEDITEVALADGRVLSGERRPSTETALHLAVYAARPTRDLV